MTALNLTKDPVTFLLLKNIIRKASQISIHDTTLNQEIAKLTQAYTNPLAVDYDGLVAAIGKIGEIVASYGERPEEEEDAAMGPLPQQLMIFKSKLDELKTKTDIDNKHFSNVIAQVDEFYKLAGGK